MWPDQIRISQFWGQPGFLGAAAFLRGIARLRGAVLAGELGEDRETLRAQLVGHGVVHRGVVERDSGGLLGLEEPARLPALAGTDDVAR